MPTVFVFAFDSKPLDLTMINCAFSPNCLLHNVHAACLIYHPHNQNAFIGRETISSGQRSPYSQGLWGRPTYCYKCQGLQWKKVKDVIIATSIMKHEHLTTKFSMEWHPLLTHVHDVDDQKCKRTTEASKNSEIIADCFLEMKSRTFVLKELTSVSTQWLVTFNHACLLRAATTHCWVIWANDPIQEVL